MAYLDKQGVQNLIDLIAERGNAHHATEAVSANYASYTWKSDMAYTLVDEESELATHKGSITQPVYFKDGVPEPTVELAPVAFTGNWHDLASRPFGEADPTLIFNKSYTASQFIKPASMGHLQNCTDSISLEVGAEYVVYFKGIRYEYTAVQDTSGYIGIGNDHYHEPFGNVTEDPFYIQDLNGVCQIYMPAKEDVTVIIYKRSNVINTIPVEYLPDTDSTLSNEGQVADAKAVGDALALKADQTALDAVSTLVGDTSVSEQISEAIDTIPQSDWNQNDETAKDYIKNRPFYEEGGLVEVLPETTIAMEYNPDEGTSAGGFEGKLELEDGVEYSIMWNGTEYKCTAVEIEDGGVTATVIGAIGLITGVNCTECPFIILPLQVDEGVWVTQVVGIGEYTQITISISKGGYIKKLDNKFLDLEWLPTTIEKEILPLTEYTEQVNEIPIEFDELIKYKEAIIYCDGGRYVWPIVHEHRELDTDCGIYLMTAPSLEATKCIIQVFCNNFSSKVTFMASGTHTLSISVPVANTIPEKFLPSKMPTSEDITQMFMEMGVLQPVSDENNVVYTDTDGKTFIL